MSMNADYHHMTRIQRPITARVIRDSYASMVAYFKQRGRSELIAELEARRDAAIAQVYGA